MKSDIWKDLVSQSSYFSWPDPVTLEGVVGRNWKYWKTLRVEKSDGTKATILNKKRLQEHCICKFIFVIIANKQRTAKSITLVPSLILRSDLVTSAIWALGSSDLVTSAKWALGSCSVAERHLLSLFGPGLSILLFLKLILKPFFTLNFQNFQTFIHLAYIFI